MRLARDIVRSVFGAGLALGLSTAPAWATGLDSGDTAWMITATALVLFMTLPGLALFYGGLVRSINVLSVLMHCFAVACIVSVLWLAFGYTPAFDGNAPLLGGLSKAFLAGIRPETLSDLAPTLPESVYFMFQMTFAIITPALIIGSYPERIRFAAVLMFSALWLMLVYVPVAHWVWGSGWLAQMNVRDYAGGIVVHLTAGVSALLLARSLGPRRGFPREMRPPHSPGMVMTGACMLWIGWFGFNGGSAVAANGSAGMAILVTHISAATGAIVWAAIEWQRFGKPSLIGAVTGAVAGLATITPASGFIGPVGALIIGAAAGVVCLWVTALVKQRLKIDDALDVFGVHGVGGALGTVLLAFLSSEALGGVGYAEGMTMASQLGVQLLALAAVGAWSAIATLAIIAVTRAAVGLRVEEETEVQGLGLTAHGESAYDL
ncbi:MAG: ammonium transporter [Alphaproteobacteria bacterium]|nr:ammonium transporter [Alphaproteobacteria bacterium]